MVFQFILAAILLLVVIVYFAVVYWQITLTIIGVIAFLWWFSNRRKRRNSDEQYEYVEQEYSNYEKYFEEGNRKIREINEYSSDNTERLDIKGMKKLLRKLEEFK